MLCIHNSIQVQSKDSSLYDMQGGDANKCGRRNRAKRCQTAVDVFCNVQVSSWPKLTRLSIDRTGFPNPYGHSQNVASQPSLQAFISDKHWM